MDTESRGYESLTDELIGKIVQFYYRTSTGYPLTVIFRVVSLFTSIEAQNIIIGDFIAGDTDIGQHVQLLKKRITGYKIVTVREFPLFIGYPHKSPLFDELLKG
jgi:hypothetical protein